jgi:hypothetical protein
MQIRDILNKLQNLEEAIPNPYKDPAQRAKFDSLSDEDKEWLTKTVTDVDGKERPGAPDISDNGILARAPNKGKPKFEPNPTGLDGAAGDMPSKTPGPVQSASEPTSDNNGGSKANNDAVGLIGAGAAGIEKTIDNVLKNPSSLDANKVQKVLSTTDDPEVQKLVTSLDAVDKILKKHGIKVETIAETVYHYYRENINNFFTPQEQMKNWTILSEENGKQKLDEFFAGAAARFAARRLAKRAAARAAAKAARRTAAGAAARGTARTAARGAARKAVDNTPLWKSPWVRGGLALGGAISLAPAAMDLYKSLKQWWNSQDQEDPIQQPQMTPQTGPEEDPSKEDPSKQDPTKTDSNEPNNPNPTDPTTGNSKDDIKIIMQNYKIILPYFEESKFQSLPEEIQIRLTKTLEGIDKFMEKLSIKG